MKNIAFIINPMSGTQNKRRLPKVINDLLDKSQWLENIVFTEHIGHAQTLAKQYATMGFDLVVAVGGDGTVREVAQGVAGSRSALGIIPMGTTNTLARHLGIPTRGNATITWLNHSEPLLCDSLEVIIDDTTRMRAVTAVTIGDTRLINCGQGVKTSIQDGLMLAVINGEQTAVKEYKMAYSGEIVVDNDTYVVEHTLTVSLQQDSLYVQAPKRF